MARYELWTHGVDVVVEFPGVPAEVRRAGWGTLVKQAQNTVNWFHFALPSASVIDSSDAFIRAVRLRADVNENARVDILHFRADGKSPILARAVSFTDRTIDETFQTADTPFTGGLVLSVHVSFLTGQPVGAVTFRSAGVVVLN